MQMLCDADESIQVDRRWLCQDGKNKNKNNSMWRKQIPRQYSVYKDLRMLQILNEVTSKGDNKTIKIWNINGKSRKKLRWLLVNQELKQSKQRAEANYHGKVSKSLQRCKKDGI